MNQNPSPGDVAAAVADGVVIRIATDPELVNEAARRAIESSLGAIARTLTEDVDAYRTAMVVGELMGMRLLGGPDSPREEPATIDPPPIPLPHVGDEPTVVMDEMGPAYGYPGFHGDGLPEETFRKIDEERAAEYAALADDDIQIRVDALVSRAVVDSVREIAAAAPVDANVMGASPEEVSLDRASRFEEGVTNAVVARATDSRIVEDPLRNPDRAPIPPYMAGPGSIIAALHILLDVDLNNAGFTDVDAPEPEPDGQWQDATAIMDEMEGPIGVSDGASPAPEAFDAADRKLAQAGGERNAPIMDEMEGPIGVSDGASPAPEAFDAADRRIDARYIAVALAFLLLAFGGWYFLSRLVADDTGDSAGTELEQLTADEQIQQTQQQQSPAVTAPSTVGDTVPLGGADPQDAPLPPTSTAPTTGRAGTPPPDASSTSTSTTSTIVLSRTLAATVTITHEGGTTSCDLILTVLGNAESVSHSMSMQCTNAPADALGVFSMARPIGGIEQVVIDSREFGVVGIEVPEEAIPIDSTGGFESYAVWSAEFGPTNQITSAVSSDPEVVCELRNAPEGTAGTHAADCTVMLQLTP